MKLLGPVQLFGTPWTVGCQVPLSMDISRQKYWSGLPFPSPGDLPDLEIELTSPVFPALQADSLPTEPFRKSHRAVLEVKKINMYKFLELCLAW